MDILYVIDMQNDFITGARANPAAEAIVEPICEFIGKFDGRVILTQDTHNWNYNTDTLEGHYLPTRHCVRGTAGWCVHDRILETAGMRATIIQKKQVVLLTKLEVDL